MHPALAPAQDPGRFAFGHAPTLEAPQRDSRPAPGHVLGKRYRIVRFLGNGGMGFVYEAENVLTQKRVALKWFPSAAEQSATRHRLLREARAGSRIRHRHVVDIYDVGIDDDALYLVMALLDGQTLAELLETRTIPIPTLLTLLIQAMRGVAEAHRLGVIHRDIKPENVFLARAHDEDSPSAVVLDFGIAEIQEVGRLTRSATGAGVGTLPFMPLEQLRGERLDERVDVYAFGVTAYLALSGCYPHFAATLPALVLHVASVDPVPLAQLRPTLPRTLCDGVMAALSRDRAARTASIEALIAALSPFASEAGFAAHGLPAERTALFVPPELASDAPVPVLPVASSRLPVPRAGRVRLSLAVAASVAALAALIVRSSPMTEGRVAPPPVPSLQRQVDAAPHFAGSSASGAVGAIPSADLTVVPAAQGASKGATPAPAPTSEEVVHARGRRERRRPRGEHSATAGVQAQASDAGVEDSTAGPTYPAAVRTMPAKSDDKRLDVAEFSADERAAPLDTREFLEE